MRGARRAADRPAGNKAGQSERLLPVCGGGRDAGFRRHGGVDVCNVPAHAQKRQNEFIRISPREVEGVLKNGSEP